MAEYIAASDLVALIRQLFPQAATTGNLTMLDDTHAGELSLALEYVKRIDLRVLSETLTPDEIRRWERASARMEATSKAWASGAKTALVAPPGTNDPHPIVLVLMFALRLPDQAKPVSVNRLPFVTDKDLRDSIAADVDSLERHLREGEWKSTIVLAGSVIEALLLNRVT